VPSFAGADVPIGADVSRERLLFAKGFVAAKRLPDCVERGRKRRRRFAFDQQGQNPIAAAELPKMANFRVHPFRGPGSRRAHDDQPIRTAKRLPDGLAEMRRGRQLLLVAEDASDTAALGAGSKAGGNDVGFEGCVQPDRPFSVGLDMPVADKGGVSVLFEGVPVQRSRETSPKLGPETEETIA
jgi:hypothetical protein